MLSKLYVHSQLPRGDAARRFSVFSASLVLAIIAGIQRARRTPAMFYGWTLAQRQTTLPPYQALLEMMNAQGLLATMSISSHPCTTQDLGDALYRSQRHLDAARLYERALAGDGSNISDKTTTYQRLSSCYERLNLTESAEFYARKTLKFSGVIGPALNLARRFERAGDLDRAANCIRMACTAYSASRQIPSDQMLDLLASDRRLLWASTFSTSYLRELRALDVLANDPNVSEETRAQVHWEMVNKAHPLLACGEELFRRQGTYADGRDYYFATPSVLSHPEMPDEDHLILTRLLNYRIDRDGRFYKEYLPANDTSGVLRSACVLYVGRHAESGDMVRILDGGFERVPYRFSGTEDPRLFRMTSGEIRVFWTSWEYSKYLGEGSRIVSGILDVNSSTVHVDHLFQSPYGRFLEKNWVVFQVPGEALRVVYEWYPLRVGTFNESQGIGKLKLDWTLETPLVFKHIRGSSNGCYHRQELWFLIHGTTWHKGQGRCTTIGWPCWTQRPST